MTCFFKLILRISLVFVILQLTIAHASKKDLDFSKELNKLVDIYPVLSLGDYNDKVKEIKHNERDRNDINENLGTDKKKSGLLFSISKKTKKYYSLIRMKFAIKKFSKKIGVDYSDLDEEERNQAEKNLLIMLVIQGILDVPMRVTAGMEDLSILYPYIDNFYDDPNIPWKQKIKLFFFVKNLLSKGRVKESHHRKIMEVKPVKKIVRKIKDIIVNYPHKKNSNLYFHLKNLNLIQILGQYLQYNPLQKKISFPRKKTLFKMLSLKTCITFIAEGHFFLKELTQEQEKYLCQLGLFVQFTDDLEDLGEDYTNRTPTFLLAKYINDYERNFTRFTNLKDLFFQDKRAIRSIDNTVESMALLMNDYFNRNEYVAESMRGKSMQSLIQTLIMNSLNDIKEESR